jgi:hypothetical protein
MYIYTYLYTGSLCIGFIGSMPSTNSDTKSTKPLPKANPKSANQATPKLSTSAPELFVSIPKKIPRTRIIYSAKPKKKNEKKNKKNNAIFEKLDPFKFPEVTERPTTRRPSREVIIYC